MFDDIKKTDQTTNGSQPRTQAAAPAQLPTQPNDNISQPLASPTNKLDDRAKLDDMFNDVDPVAEATPPVLTPDTLAKPSAIQSGKLQPITNQSVPVSQPSTQPVSTDPNQILMEEDSGRGSLLKKILVALVGIILLAAVTYAAYYYFQNKDNSEVPPVVNNLPEQNNNQENPSPNNEVIPPTPSTPEPANIDTDADGLNDIEEAHLGTDINNPDTDGDGLFDREEVRTYGTDPLNPDSDNDGLFDREEVIIWDTEPLDSDSDNDGYLDGVEVSRGYNPNGPGELPKTEN